MGTVRPTSGDIAIAWRKECVSKATWSKATNQAGAVTGISRGYFVESKSIPGRRAYLKPVYPEDEAAEGLKRCAAAREKIAFDLAYEVGLGAFVPPAVLFENPTPAKGNGRAAAITLVLFPDQHSWAQIRRIDIDSSPAGIALARFFSEGSRVLPFDTWLGQTDHGDHPHNVVLGFNPENRANSSLVFLDYANSMGFDGSWPRGAAPFPDLILKNHDAEAIRETIKRIEELDEKTIQAITGRIPELFLPKDEASALADELIQRRMTVRTDLDTFLKTAKANV